MRSIELQASLLVGDHVFDEELVSQTEIRVNAISLGNLPKGVPLLTRTIYVRTLAFSLSCIMISWTPPHVPSKGKVEWKTLPLFAPEDKCALFKWRRSDSIKEYHYRKCLTQHIWMVNYQVVIWNRDTESHGHDWTYSWWINSSCWITRAIVVWWTSLTQQLAHVAEADKYYSDDDYDHNSAVQCIFRSLY